MSAAERNLSRNEQPGQNVCFCKWLQLGVIFVVWTFTHTENTRFLASTIRRPEGEPFKLRRSTQQIPCVGVVLADLRIPLPYPHMYAYCITQAS